VRKLLAAAVLLLVVAGMGYLYHDATTPYRTLPRVEVDAVQAAAAERKLDTLRNAGAETGSAAQQVTVSESFTDSELSSLANQYLQGQSLPFDNLVLHATGNRTIEAQATAHWAGQSLPLFLVVTIQVVGGNRLQVTIIDSKLGQLSVPRALSDQIDSALIQSVSPGAMLNIEQLTITITQGLVTVSGVALPA
jgi:hypothetical protein